MKILLDSILKNDDLVMSIGYSDVKNVDLIHYFNNISHTKKLTIYDKSYIVDKNKWIVNSILNEYPSKNSHYVIDGKLYMCIQNNNSGVSTEKPLTTSVFNEKTSDGYVWRYLLTLKSDNLLDYIKLYDTNNVYSVNGKIASVEYNIINNIIYEKKPIYIVYDKKGNLSNGSGLILDYTYEDIVNDLYVSNGGIGYSKDDIVLFTESNDGNGAIININVMDNGGIKLIDFTNGGNYTDVKAHVVGDGYGASLICTTKNGSLDTVEVENIGTGYTYAHVIITNSKNSTILRTNLESDNGLGYDIKSDISSYMLISKTFNVDVDTDVNFVLLHNTQKSNEIPTLYEVNDFDTKTLTINSDNRIQLIIEGTKK